MSKASTPNKASQHTAADVEGTKTSTWMIRPAAASKVPRPPTSMIRSPISPACASTRTSPRPAASKSCCGRSPSASRTQQDFVRVHPDPAYREQLPALELKEERELYLVGPEHAGRPIDRERSRLRCSPRSTDKASFSFGRCGCRGPTARRTNGGVPAREAAELAMTKWVRVKANMSSARMRCSPPKA